MGYRDTDLYVAVLMVVIAIALIAIAVKSALMARDWLRRQKQPITPAKTSVIQIKADEIKLGSLSQPMRQLEGGVIKGKVIYPGVPDGMITATMEGGPYDGLSMFVPEGCVGVRLSSGTDLVDLDGKASLAYVVDASKPGNMFVLQAEDKS